MSKFIILLLIGSILQMSIADTSTFAATQLSRSSALTSSTLSSASSSSSTSSSASASSSSSSQAQAGCGPPQYHPQKCKKANEVWEICPAPCPFRTCGIDDTLIDCIPAPLPGDPNCLPPACRCKPQFFRDDKGNCVPWDHCPKCNKPNEVYDACDAPCPGRKCSVDPRLVRCKTPPKLGDKDCVIGCRCIDGYARNSNGVCIPREKCPKKPPTCGTNEVYDQCPDCNPQTCATRNNRYNCPLRPANNTGPGCNPSCRCIKGYWRNTNGECIPVSECPPIQPTCGSNEVYDPCPDCSPQTCRTMNKTYHCPLRPANNTGPGCKPSCRCKKGYWRNAIGDCIAASDCLKCTKPNEYFSCGGACDNECYNIKEQNQTSCPIVNIQCNRKCYCEKDYARDYKNDCIPITDCPTCPANEKYDPCPETLCPPQTCDEAGFPSECPAREDGAACPGKPGCVCVDGYLRDKNGVCIPSEQCPSCGGDKNATLGCGVNCNRLCSNVNQKEPQFCILICYNNACDCKTDKDGNEYYYDANTKKCVLPQDCTPQCKANEVYDECINGGCRKKDCADINKPVACVHPKVCKAGCICASGYLRAKNGTCVPSEQCVPPPNCTGNEEFSKCGRDGCAKYYCSDLDSPTICRDTFQCIPQCECKEGFLRASFDNRTCVPVDQCERKCNDNEQYSDCPSALCQPQSCKQAGFPVPCPIVGPDGQCSGDPGCICKSGYLRNNKGICVPQDQCPSCGGDKNAIPGCGNYCGNTCSTRDSTEPIFCPQFCNLNGCDCRKGYLYDGNLKKCVRPEKCTPTCQVNEAFSNCTNGVCRPQNCSKKGKNVACPAIAEGSCIQGCVCKENYLRAGNGTCIPQDQCEPTCPDGEVLNTCPAIKCDAEYCPKSRNDPQSCISPKNCQPPRCVCGFNRHRDRKSGKCIATSSCPPFPCDGPNEKYDSCPPVCPGEKCLDYLNNATCPRFRIGIVVACKPACRCNKGYYRSYDGICVSSSRCKDSACKPNEEYSTCTNGLCRPQNCEDKDTPVACPAIAEGDCQKGCVCKKKYLKDDSKECIPEDECEDPCE